MDPARGIVRMEFLGGELLYAMRVVSHGTFNLCPSELCNPEDGEGGACAVPETPAKPVEFHPFPEVDPGAVEAGRRIMLEGGLDVGGIEYLETQDGRRVIYDINANSNLRPASGGRSASIPSSSGSSTGSFVRSNGRGLARRRERRGAHGRDAPFHFDFVSPYAFLAWTRIHTIAVRAGRSVEPVRSSSRRCSTRTGHEARRGAGAATLRGPRRSSASRTASACRSICLRRTLQPAPRSATSVADVARGDHEGARRRSSPPSGSVRRTWKIRPC